MRKIKCPRCGKLLEELKISSTTGQVILLDKCVMGCGIWFDRWEIFKASYDDIKRIDDFDEIFMDKKAENILCPICNVKMGKYRNPAYNLNFDLDFCNKCYGFWFDKGEAIKFKDVWRKKIDKLKNETKITLSPSVQNFEKLAMDEEEADRFLNFVLNILRFFIPFI